ncbi:tetratricopeptide repeat protein [Kordia periserrulae]|uniref:Oxygen sensor histidine kinase NreB n=1 Tax=Kordia periserrulae TaxID=701523 RepID=A0A2T6BYC4_9FLAO|nr:tetratricopeptide repeat protein [Kordia periserrulae]PTX61094.1 tetratricopeptide repeat protein [Kordia periserrulae]
MMKHFFLVFFLYFITATSQNQHVIDSLEIIINTSSDNKVIVDSYNELAWLFTDFDPKKAFNYAKKAELFSDSISYENGYIDSQVRIGDVYIEQYKYEEAEQIFLEVLKLEIKRDYNYGIGRAYNQLSLIYRDIEDFVRSSSFGEKALAYFKRDNNEYAIGIAFNNLGYSYLKQDKLDKALTFLLEGLAIGKKNGNQSMIADSFLNLGLLYNELNDYDRALDYFRKGEKIAKNNQLILINFYNNIGVAYFEKGNDSLALINYNLVLDLHKEYKTDGSDSEIYNNLGNVYYIRNNLDKALENYTKSLNISKKNGLKNTKAEVYNNLGNIFFKKDQKQKALEYYLKAEDIAIKTENDNLSLQILENIKNVHQDLGNTSKSNEYINRLLEFKTKSAKRLKKLLQIRTNFDAAQKRIDLLKKDKEIISVENERKQTYIYSLVAISLLLLLLFFASKKASKEKQRAQASEIRRQEIEKSLKNQELKSINTMLEGQEKERQRIAKDLHDSIGNTLSMVKLHFETVEENIEKFKNSANEEYKKAIELLDKACNDVRKISREMDSGVLGNFGLIAALEDLKEILESSNKIKVELNIYGLVERLDNNIEITIYRIFQELISNILKYANAKNIILQLLERDDKLLIYVEDDGIGFNFEESRGKGMGLKNIEARVESLNGTFQVDSESNNGAFVSIEIPIKEEI